MVGKIIRAYRGQTLPCCVYTYQADGSTAYVGGILSHEISAYSSLISSTFNNVVVYKELGSSLCKRCLVHVL